MIKEGRAYKGRSNNTRQLSSDLIVAGGGMAGVCSAITAAREGMSVILVQDRPILGGNASSEVRLWILGATSHMGNNNRWAREGGVIDEILVENLYRNKEGNPLILDTILLEKVRNEANIILLLNTSVYEVVKSNESRIESIRAFCSQNSTMYELSAPLFCDSSGDGIVGFLSGASFRMGAESKEDFGELFAPESTFGELLGHSLYFYSKRVENPVKFIAPDFALKDITQLSRHKIISKEDQGCRFWWVEYGGRRDTIHETEEIKWELWKVVYGIWNHIKNSGEYEDVDNLTLEWVGTIPGKRESRRFEGKYMLKQQDVVKQKTFDDAVAFGGWALDLHPADGVYSELPGCIQYHSKGIYQIPLGSYVSKDIENLFLAGRIISASHVAFGSTRVMATCALGAQAVAIAASQCVLNNKTPHEILEPENVREIQQRLSCSGQSIPGIPISHEADLMDKARIDVSSTFVLDGLSSNGLWQTLDLGVAQLLPFEKGEQYHFSFHVKAKTETKLMVQFRTSSIPGNYTPDVVVEAKELELKAGEQVISFTFASELDQDQYAFVTFMKNEKVSLQSSDQRMTGIMTVFNGSNEAVNNFGCQMPPKNSGIESFEFWIPQRQPLGYNLAFTVSPDMPLFNAEYLRNGYVRPYLRTNAWAADVADTRPQVHLKWEYEVSIDQIKLFWDTDYDNSLESVLMQHPEPVGPFCIPSFSIYADGRKIYEEKESHQTISTIRFTETIIVSELMIKLTANKSGAPASLFEILVD
jgi:hypothetical protein